MWSKQPPEGWPVSMGSLSDAISIVQALAPKLLASAVMSPPPPPLLVDVLME